MYTRTLNGIDPMRQHACYALKTLDPVCQSLQKFASAYVSVKM